MFLIMNIKRMLIYEAHRKKFNELNDSIQASTLCNFFSKLFEDNKENINKEN